MVERLLPYAQLVPSHFSSGDVPEWVKDSYPLPEWMFTDSPYNSLQYFDIGDVLTEQVCGVHLIKKGTTINGKPFVRLNVYDRGHQLPGVYWASSHELAEDLSALAESCGIAFLSGYIGEYPKGSGQPQVVIRGFSSTTTDPRAVIPTAWPTYDIYAHLYSMVGILSQLREPLNEIGIAALKGSWPRFGMAPAAIRHHHAFLGGLLIHTSQVVHLINLVLADEADVEEQVRKISWRFDKLVMKDSFTSESTYPSIASVDHTLKTTKNLLDACRNEPIDRDIAILAGALHDFGKTTEYQYGTSLSMDPKGKLVGHIHESTAASLRYAGQYDLNEDDRLRLLHAVLAHHGLYEYGSPVLPQTPEAWMVHWADYLCSRTA